MANITQSSVIVCNHRDLQILILDNLTCNDLFVFLELHSTRKDLEQMKKQAEGVSKEYDRLLAEHGKLQVIFTLLPV